MNYYGQAIVVNNVGALHQQLQKCQYFEIDIKHLDGKLSLKEEFEKIQIKLEVY